jgi:ParB/RepB/Spo0J family partition protein
MARKKGKTSVELAREALEEQATRTGGPAPGSANPPLPAGMAGRAMEIVLWPAADLVPHPDNPRAIDERKPKFRDLVESIKANGIIEPLTVRRFDGDVYRQVLSGHRRLAAAQVVGLDRLPVRDLGEIPDALAYDIVAMANLHEDLTPLEEGVRVAKWLDKYGEDAAAVASKLGKTRHWVLTHAMIGRNLIPAWKEAVARDAAEPQDRYGHGGFGRFDRWTAEHWVRIARLPAALQEHWLQKVEKDYRFNPWNATAETVADWLKTEKLFLVRAPFESARVCADCPKRTDAINQLLWEDPDVQGDEGEQVRCLDPKCWQRQSEKAARDAYRATRDALLEKAGITGDAARAAVVPVSLLAEPKDHWGSKHEHYRQEIAALKRAVGKDLVTVDRVEVVKEGTKGAVPAIVVAGKGKNKLVYVKIQKDPTPAELAKEKAEKQKQQRWEKVVQTICKELAGKTLGDVPLPQLETVFFLCHLSGSWPEVDAWSGDFPKRARAYAAAFEKNPADFLRTVMGEAWQSFVGTLKQQARWPDRSATHWVVTVAAVFGIDANERYNRLLAKEQHKPVETAAGEPAKKKRGRPKKAVATPAVPHDEDTAPEPPGPGVCPVRSGAGECVGDGNCGACARNPEC